MTVRQQARGPELGSSLRGRVGATWQNEPCAGSASCSPAVSFAMCGFQHVTLAVALPRWGMGRHGSQPVSRQRGKDMARPLQGALSLLGRSSIGCIGPRRCRPKSAPENAPSQRSRPHHTFVRNAFATLSSVAHSTQTSITGSVGNPVLHSRPLAVELVQCAGLRRGGLQNGAGTCTGR